MEARILENYCLSEYLLGPFRTICVRNYTSWFSAVFPFLTMAVLHLLGLPTWPQIFFWRYKCKRSNITLSHIVKNLAHSKSCPCNHECRPTAHWGGRAAVCSMVFGSGTGAVEGWAFGCRAGPAVLPSQPGPARLRARRRRRGGRRSLLCSPPGAPRSCGWDGAHSSGSWPDVRSRSPNMTVSWKLVVSCFFFHEEINFI